MLVYSERINIWFYALLLSYCQIFFCKIKFCLDANFKFHHGQVLNLIYFLNCFLFGSTHYCLIICKILFFLYHQYLCFYSFISIKFNRKLQPLWLTILNFFFLSFLSFSLPNYDNPKFVLSNLEKHLAKLKFIQRTVSKNMSN